MLTNSKDFFSSGTHSWPVIFTHTHTHPPNSNLLLLKNARHGVLTTNRLLQGSWDKKIVIEDVELKLPLSSSVKQWMLCAAMTWLATNTPSTTLGSLSVFFLHKSSLFFCSPCDSAPLSFSSLPPSLSAVPVYWSRREHWRFGRRGHGGRRSFSGGQRWKPLWSWVSVGERGGPDGSPRRADEPRLLGGHGGQWLSVVGATPLAWIQSRGTGPQLQPSLGLGLLWRRLF